MNTTLDLTNVEEVSPDVAPVRAPPSSATFDVSRAQASVPREAPVSEPRPLSGKEKAGVWLTWGIIGVLAVFVLVSVRIIAVADDAFISAMNELLNPQGMSGISPKEAIEVLAKQQADYRSFWVEFVKLIVGTVLFPTLTALLGYVFGTTRAK